MYKNGMEVFSGHFYFIGVSAVFCIGLYIIITNQNLVRKLIGLSLFQSSVMLFFVSLGKVSEGKAPIIKNGIEVYANPLPHVLMLTAIVVGLASLALGLAITTRIKKEFGSIEEGE